MPEIINPGLILNLLITYIISYNKLQFGGQSLVVMAFSMPDDICLKFLFKGSNTALF